VACVHPRPVTSTHSPLPALCQLQARALQYLSQEVTFIDMKTLSTSLSRQVSCTAASASSSKRVADWWHASVCFPKDGQLNKLPRVGTGMHLLVIVVHGKQTRTMQQHTQAPPPKAEKKKNPNSIAKLSGEEQKQKVVAGNQPSRGIPL
jgi:hypothetical protein